MSHQPTAGLHQRPLHFKEARSLSEAGRLQTYIIKTCGLTPERAAALRAELDRNKVVSVETAIDAAIAAKFRYTRP